MRPAQNGRRAEKPRRSACFMMTVIIAGSAALIGPENVKRFAREGFKVAGIT